MTCSPSPHDIHIGVAGAGIIAGVHLPNLRQMPGVRIAAICDSDVGRAEAAAGAYGATAYADTLRMLDEADLHALFVCLPPFARGDIIARAVERGLHVYVEKPAALDLEAAGRTMEAIEAAGVISSVGFMWRYAPVVERARAALAAAGPSLLLGRLLNSPPGPAWAFDRKLSGGLLVEFAAHMADLLRYLGGEVEHVSGSAMEVTAGPSSRGCDSAVLALHFLGGGSGSLETTWALHGAIWDVQIVAAEAQLHLSLNPERLAGEIRGERVDAGSEQPHNVTAHGFGGPSWYLAAGAFVDAVRSGSADGVRSSYRDGVRTLALTLAADEAVRTRQTVAVIQI